MIKNYWLDNCIIKKNWDYVLYGNILFLMLVVWCFEEMIIKKYMYIGS